MENEEVPQKISFSLSRIGHKEKKKRKLETLVGYLKWRKWLTCAM